MGQTESQYQSPLNPYRNYLFSYLNACIAKICCMVVKSFGMVCGVVCSILSTGAFVNTPLKLRPMTNWVPYSLTMLLLAWWVRNSLFWMINAMSYVVRKSIRYTTLCTYIHVKQASSQTLRDKYFETHCLVCGLRFMIYDLWSMVYKRWSMTYDLWSMVYNLWSMIYGVWSLVSDLWSMIYGQWSTIYGLWSMIFSSWPTIYCLRSMIHD